jgi:ribosome maturation factor RimP
MSTRKEMEREKMEKLNLLEDLFRREVEGLGYRLYHMEYVKEEGMNILRFYIDRPEGIALEDCEKVSRRMSDLLDEKDPIAEDYNLEVSSPGIFRTLFTLEHMKEALGAQVMVRTKKPVKGAKKFKAILKMADETMIVVTLGNEDVEIPMDNLKQLYIEVDL